MANIAISELETEATVLNNDDLLLVSKKNGTSFTSAKMKAGVIISDISGTSAKCDAILTTLDSHTNELASIKSDVSDIKSILSVHSEYLANLTDLTTRIGNKIFNGEYGEDKTLTLTYDTALASAAPTMSPESEGGVYAKGTRVVITAANPKDAALVKFVGWYQGGALISNQRSYSYEVTSDITLNAKYSVYNTQEIKAKFKIINNSSYNFDNSKLHVFPVFGIKSGETKNIELSPYIDNTNYCFETLCYSDSYKKVNITFTQSGMSYLWKDWYSRDTGLDPTWGFLRIKIPQSISKENYDGTYKDYGTITITNK